MASLPFCEMLDRCLAPVIVAFCALGLLTNSTNASPVDSDGDGVNDFREGRDGTDPNDRNSFNPFSVGLVAFYPFRGTAEDESGHENHLIPGDATFTEGRTGNLQTAIEFAGTQNNPRSVKNTGISGRAAFSVSVWIFPKNEPVWPYGSVVGWGGPAAGQKTSLYYRPYSEGAGNFNLHVDEDYVGATVQSDPNSLAGRWSHIVYAYDPARNVFDIYLNGSLQTNNYRSFNMEEHNLIDGPLGLGHPESNWRVAIDEIRIYGRTLTSSEIASLYTQEPIPAEVDHPTVEVFGPVHSRIRVSLSGVTRIIPEIVPPGWEYDELDAALGGVFEGATAFQGRLAGEKAPGQRAPVTFNFMPIVPEIQAITMPLHRSVKAGTVAKIPVTVWNSSATVKRVRVQFRSSDESQLAAPQPMDVDVPARNISSGKPGRATKVVNVRVGDNGGKAELVASVVGLHSAPCTVGIKPSRKR